MALRPLAVDWCCGRGGWSRGLIQVGFRTVGVDLADFSRYYPGEFRRADIRELRGTEFGRPLLSVASPPCQSFSTANARTRDPEAGLGLVRECVRLFRASGTRWWALENVRGSVPYISRILGPPLVSNGPWFVWGSFPPLALPRLPLKGHALQPRIWVVRSGREAGRVQHIRNWGWRPADELAVIPLELASHLGRAILSASRGPQLAPGVSRSPGAAVVGPSAGN